MKKLYTKGTHFQTEDGKEVLLHGVNVVCKEADQGYLFSDLENSFRAFREKGFNLIRLGIFWDGVEPFPGQYDREYLNRIKNTVALAERYGLYVVLDMHQDLYARKFADGAPDWATLDEGASHSEDCDMWYEAYLASEAVMQAGDRFWQNAPASDGVGLLGHYAAMWEMLAEEFGGCSNIAAFEPMNEPFLGSLARDAAGAAWQQTAENYPGFDLREYSSASPEAMQMLLGIMSQQLARFDASTLMDFYRRMQAAIRKHSDIPIVTGGNFFCSSFAHTGITRLSDEDGEQIYGPHGYDLVVDSESYDGFDPENVERIFADKRATQEELKLPVIVGEWGGFPAEENTAKRIAHMNDILEKNLWSSAYWQYQPGMENDPNHDTLSRAYPMETAGSLVSYHYEEKTRELRLTYHAAAGGVTRVYCPGRVRSAVCSGEAACTTTPVGNASVYLDVTAARNELLTVTVTLES